MKRERAVTAAARIAAIVTGAAVLIALLVLLAHPVALSAAGEPTTLRWATSSVGSAGHRAKVSLMTLLNRELPDYDIHVMPTPGAIASIRGYAMGQFDGYYGADIAFRELAEDGGRFRGFRARMQREPVQSFWTYTMEVGLAVRARDREQYGSWRALSGRPVFTGPAPWDVRAHLERALGALSVGHRYRELDLGLAGSALAGGSIDAVIVYTVGQRSLASWIAEAELAAEIAVLNPDAEERALLRDAGMDAVAVDSGVFRTDVGTREAWLLPFFYGFHVGAETPERDVFRMLEIIEEHAGELARSDPVFAQVAEDMPGMQRRGVAASVGAVKVHPGLARYMRERGVWREEWDARVAE